MAYSTWLLQELLINLLIWWGSQVQITPLIFIIFVLDQDPFYVVITLDSLDVSNHSSFYQQSVTYGLSQWPGVPILHLLSILSLVHVEMLSSACHLIYLPIGSMLMGWGNVHISPLALYLLFHLICLPISFPFLHGLVSLFSLWAPSLCFSAVGMPPVPSPSML